jgi:arginine decarboxylase
MFFTKGVGIHKRKLQSFEFALRRAGIERFNLVNISSIFPPNCKIISHEKGLEMLYPGEIVYTVMSKIETDEPNRLLSAAVGLAMPVEKDRYGYISEYETYGVNGKIAGDYAEDLAASMLATTLGIDFDPEKAWDERKQVYKASGKIFRTTNVCQSAEGNKNGLWTTCIAAAVFIEENKI